jgi:LuxR family maltose regulon positive regulatory protein
VFILNLLTTLKQHIEANDTIDQFLVDYVVDLFKDEHILRYYQLIKSIGLVDDRAKVIKCWLALFAGDNLTLSVLSKHIDDGNLDDLYRGFYTDLQSLGGVFGHPKERLVYSDKALKILEGTDSFFLANAYLTRGQLHRGFEAFRDASRYFEKAYHLFMKHEAIFPAVLSLTNSLLSQFHLGAFDHIFETTKQARLVGSVQSGVDMNYFDLISLPEGMALIQKGQYKSGLFHLKKAYKMIHAFKLVHMHGYIEIYLLSGTQMTHQKRAFDQILTDTKQLFEHMHYPMMQAIIIYGDLLRQNKLADELIESVMVQVNESDGPLDPFLVELATVFYVFDYTDMYSLKQLHQQIEHYRYTGDRISLAQMLLLLAEYYYRQQDKRACKQACLEYLELKDQLGIKYPLHKYPYHFLDIIKQLDKDIEIVQRLEVDLTEKEKDILLDIAEGCSNKEIASKHFITVGTVKWHTNNIYSKLHVKGRFEAVKVAKKMNII